MLVRTCGLVPKRPESSVEAKLADTIRIGKGSGTYRFHDIRPEV